MIFVRTRDDSLIQIAGRNIFVFLNHRLGRTPSGKKSEPKKKVFHDKYNLKKESDSYLNNKRTYYWDEMLNRNRLYYSSHMNRGNTFFKRHILPVKPLEPMKLKEQTFKLFAHIFEFCRLRRYVKDSVLKLVGDLLQTHPKIDYNRILSKHCPLPENWGTMRK